MCELLSQSQGRAMPQHMGSVTFNRLVCRGWGGVGQGVGRYTKASDSEESPSGNTEDSSRFSLCVQQDDLRTDTCDFLSYQEQETCQQ